MYFGVAMWMNALFSSLMSLRVCVSIEEIREQGLRRGRACARGPYYLGNLRKSMRNIRLLISGIESSRPESGGMSLEYTACYS
jgi:hypothetical protein